MDALLPLLNLAILRPDDLLVLSVQAVNFRLDTSAPDRPRLVQDIPGDAAYLVYMFPPQSIAEQAFFETGQITQQPSFNTPPGPPGPPNASDTLAPPGSVAAWVASQSRLVFRLPSGLTEVEFSIAGLLDWSQLEPVLPAAAQVLPGASSGPSGPPPIAAPGSLETSLELPYRLMMSPNIMPGGVQPGWKHAAVPVLHAGRAELWHTRLGQVAQADGQILFTEASTASPVPLRAVWSPDFVANGQLPTSPPTPPNPRTAMEASDRDQIVILTSGFSGYTLTTETTGPQPYVPAPVNASRVFLSALGGWLTSRGAWPFPVSYPLRDTPGHLSEAAELGPAASVPDAVGLDLIEWNHLATQGRDHYVKIVYEGYAYPHGHRLTVVKVTERKVLAPQGAANSPVAYLRQRMYIVPREHEKSYLDEPYQNQGREMPLASLIRIDTKVTPDLDPPPTNANWFWINVGGKPFQFHMTARDLAGQEFNFLAPLIFVSLSANTKDLADVAADYVAAEGGARRRCAVGGQKVAYADPAAGDTMLKTRAFYFTTQAIGKQAPPYPVAPFIPVLGNAEVTVPSLAEILGQQTAVLISLYKPYLASGLDPNAGVFADIEGTKPGVSFSADRSGGFAQPNIVLCALSARKGLVSGAASDAAQGKINPGAYFGPTDAKLFGTVPLGDLIPVDGQGLASAANNAPTIRTQAQPDATHPKELVTVLTWQPQLTNFDKPTNPAKVLFNAGGTSALTLQVTIRNDLSGNPPTSKATGELTNFTLKLFGVVHITIASIKFTSTNGAKSLVTLDLADSNPIGFEGPLQFVQALADILPAGLFGGQGPSIQATSTELEVSYTLGLPPVTCGVFSLEHIAIMAGLDLPYLDGKPVVEFAFASRSKPATLTVEIFGGSAFVHLIVGADGVQMVEGSLEFGGNFSLDIGVASGGVHAMAGIYFQLSGTNSDLTGFVDIGGEVSVLGIISISLDLNLSLSWQQSGQGNMIEGRATMTVSVHVLFFSASVGISVERSFSAGGGTDPDVGQLMTAEQWSDYAGAFA